MEWEAVHFSPGLFTSAYAKYEPRPSNSLIEALKSEPEALKSELEALETDNIEGLGVGTRGLELC